MNGKVVTLFLLPFPSPMPSLVRSLLEYPSSPPPKTTIPTTLTIGE